MTIRHINRKGTPPRAKGQLERGARLLRRETILDSTLKVAYGPDQPPEACNLLDDTGTVAATYQPPTEWARTATLLRMPQVVWLSAFFAEFGTTDSFGVHHDDSPTTYTYETDLLWAEAYRLQGVFQDVRDRLAALRTGRTWVAAIDWMDPLAFPYWDADYDIHHTNPHHLAPASFVPLLMAPDADFPFIGTNFLHVYAGDYFETGNPNNIGVNDDAQAAAVARLQAAYAAFARYRVLYYSYIDSDLTGEFVTGDFIPDPDWTPLGKTPTSIVAGNRASESRDDVAALIADLDSDGEDHGVSIVDDSTTIDVDSLIRLIADHFRFDAGTGADVE